MSFESQKQLMYHEFSKVPTVQVNYKTAEPYEHQFICN